MNQQKPETMMGNCCPTLLTLTVAQIRDLADFAGLIVDIGGMDKWSLETGISIAELPETGLDYEDGRATHYDLIAYCTDYPEEGCVGLGPEITPVPMAATTTNESPFIGEQL